MIDYLPRFLISLFCSILEHFIQCAGGICCFRWCFVSRWRWYMFWEVFLRKWPGRAAGTSSRALQHGEWGPKSLQHGVGLSGPYPQLIFLHMRKQIHTAKPGSTDLPHCKKARGRDTSYCWPSPASARLVNPGFSGSLAQLFIHLCCEDYMQHKQKVVVPGMTRAFWLVFSCD